MTDLSLVTREEIDSLAQLEDVIERGIKTFIEVGQALMTIRDQRLYRADYATFEEYCGQRFAFSRQRAYQLMSAAEVALALSTTGLQATVFVPNERIARALGKLDDPQAQRLALTTAIATAPDGKLTAEWVESSVAVVEDALGTDGLVDPGANTDWTAMNSAITTEAHRVMLIKRAQILSGK